MPSKSKVSFFSEHPGFKLEKRTQLKSFIEYILKKEKKKIFFINYIFCSDKRLLEINRQFLHHDYYTDIISFDLSEFADTEVRAEIYISVDRVKDNAKTLNCTFKSELHRVIFHGALHLCGYSDKTKKEKEEIRKKEDFYLSEYL